MFDALLYESPSGDEWDLVFVPQAQSRLFMAMSGAHYRVVGSLEEIGVALPKLELTIEEGVKSRTECSDIETLTVRMIKRQPSHTLTVFSGIRLNDGKMKWARAHADDVRFSKDAERLIGIVKLLLG